MPALVPEVVVGQRCCDNMPRNRDDDIVISGISGRFPESDNIEEFAKNLFEHVDMVNEDETRWPKGLYGLPSRSGKVKDLSKFDAPFFGVHPKQAEVMDPQLRILLEAVYEAIVDSGENPQDIRGSKTGVFVGVSTVDSEEYWTTTLHMERINGYGLTGCSRSMFANRISFTFDFKGPSFAVDTACSSSMMALNEAFLSIRTGQCDAAIVAGTNMTLNPGTSAQFQCLGMLSSEGKCKAFDADGKGYVRSEGIAALYIRKSKGAKRIYANVINVKTNTDGFKDLGITYPSGAMQKKLIEEVYSECGINPADVAYIEAHGTGTKAGDPQEINSIAEIFCKGRTTPLLIGSVKSNMGHSEASSGVCALAKVLIAMEAGCLPGNLHFKSPNEDIPALHDNRLQVVDKNTPWNGGYVGINSFGFGGANVHVLIKSHPKPKQASFISKIPKLITVSGRTLGAVDKFIKKIEAEPRDDELLRLIHEIHLKNIPGHMYRGYAILDDDAKREIFEQINEKREIWFVFSGMGSQWAGMGRDLMAIEPFANGIRKCAAALSPYGIDLIKLFEEAKESDFDNIINSFISIAAIQVALVDVLTSVGIHPDGIIGHSVGELGCAYADGAFTAEQTILSSYWRGRSVVESNLPLGVMAATGLSWEEAKKRCTEGVYPACHNAPDSVTISGSPREVDQLLEQLQAEGIFSKKVMSNNIAFHSKYIQAAGQKLRESLEKVIPVPKQRSKKWISTSIPQSGWGTQLASQSSAAYHVNNLLSPVLFHDGLQHIPENAVVIEIAPHGLLQAILKRSLPKSCSHVPMTKKGQGLDFLVSSIGRMYNVGLNPAVHKIYPNVSFPVSRGTPMISSMVEWDHSVTWDVAEFVSAGARSGETVIEVDMSSDEYKYIQGHAIDGRVLFPATGYMTLVWKTFAKLNQKEFEDFPVVMEDVQFKRATIMPKEGTVKFIVNIFDGSGEFELCEGGAVVVSGKIQKLTEQKPIDIGPVNTAESNGHLPLKNPHVYRELRLRGYDYQGLFRGIKNSDNSGNIGELEWKDNWVSFMDTMLQFSLIGKDTRDLHLPTRIQRLILDPAKHLAQVKNLKEDEGVPIQMNKYIGVVQSGGIEVAGMKASLAPRKLITHSQPKLEQYSFVPYFSNKDIGSTAALTVPLHIVFENFNTLTQLKFAETGHKVQSDTLLASQVLNILETEPILGVDMTILTDETKDLSSLIEQFGIKIQNKDLTKSSLENKYHCIVTTKNVEDGNTLENIKSSLHPEGFLLVQSSSDISASLMEKVGFNYISKTVGELKVYHLYKLMVPAVKPAIFIEITYKNFNWLETLKNAMKVCENDMTQTLVLYNVNETECGIIGMANCIKYEPGGENIRCVQILDSSSDTNNEMNGEGVTDQLKKGLVMNVMKQGQWGSMRHSIIGRSNQAELRVEHAYVNTLVRGDLSSLRWIEGPLSFYKPENYPGLEMVTVYYSSINFRDIMLTTGKLNVDAIPGGLSGQDCVLGLEFSGRNPKGQRVMGIMPARALATTVVTDSLFLWPVPSEWTLEQAASVPVVYATSYYALLVRGNMKKGDSVLIHAGTGGVGQAAIRIALGMGCNVFTTAGTQQKREFLLKTFPKLNPKQVGNSRDTSFEQMVLNETKGRGVDLVLNSLADDKLQASVRCLAREGRFLEIGKFDLSNNTPLGMSIFLKNTSFHGILLDALFAEDCRSQEKYDVVKYVTEGIKSGLVQPLPVTTFSSSQVEQSFRYMATGKHIGKVVLKIKDEEKAAVIEPKITPVMAISKTYMNPDKSYILVGGLGGFGLELCQWMLYRGARHIILTSRSGVTTGYQSLCLRRWENCGIKIHISTQDATTIDGAQKLIQTANGIAPVGGIFNLAGVLRDGLIQDQTESNYITVCKSKIETTKSLDEASRIHCGQLDYFVVFSSISCGRGNAGQSNYGLANSTMERICEQRQHLGLPGIAIQWGAIGDVGMIMEELGGSNDSVIGGTIPQRMPSCMESMDYFLQVPHPVVGSMVMAEKRKVITGEAQVSLIEAVANILGIKDAKTVNNRNSLADLGMDSLMGAEIKQTLERNFDLVLSAQEIRSLTFGKLEDISKSNSSSGTTEAATQIGNDQVQFQGQTLIPKETIVKMKEGKGKQNLFFIHAIEGDVSSLIPLAEQMPETFTVYGLQASAAVPLESVSTMASHYVKEIKAIQPKGPYTICGYSFGACIGFEMTLHLEKCGDSTSLMLIDGSPKYVSSAIFRTREMRSNKDFDTDYSTALTYFISLFKSNINFEETLEQLKKSKANERLHTVSEILDGRTQFTRSEIEDAARVFFQKLLAANEYTPASKSMADVLLVKASDNYMDGSKDYGLSEMCKKTVKVHTLPGDHRSIIRNKGATEIATIIKSQILKD